MPVEFVSVISGDAVTLDEIGQYVQVPNSDDNDLLQSLIRGAVEDTQRRTGRKLLSTVCRLWLAEFPHGNDAIVIPFPPLQEVAEITYVDSDGDVQTLDEDEYLVDAVSSPGRVLPAYGGQWPFARSVGTSDHPHPVKIEFACGYGDSHTDIPDDLRTIVKGLAKMIFENPNPILLSGAQPVEVPMHVGSLIAANKDQYQYPAGTW